VFDVRRFFYSTHQEFTMTSKQKSNRDSIRKLQAVKQQPQLPDDEDTQPTASGHGGKVENDFNQMGEQKPTQRNEGQRTPSSRSDRESHVGSSNQLQLRRGGNSR
jgi:hypothetical protein